MNKFFPIDQSAPTGRLPDEEALIDVSGCLKITLLAEAETKIVVLFDDYIAYRKLDEGDAFRTLREIADSGQLGHLLYLVENSDFIAWFLKENQFVRNREGLKHYCMTTSNSLIDVICFGPPKLQ
jgi:hypothetical protein